MLRTNNSQIIPKSMPNPEKQEHPHLELRKGSNQNKVKPKKNSKSNQLSEREEIIVCLIAKGFKNKDIAVELGTTEQIIKNNIRLIYDKTGMWDRIELMKWVEAKMPDKLKEIKNPNAIKLSELSKDEKTIVQLIRKGLKDKNISIMLGINEQALRGDVRLICHKTGMSRIEIRMSRETVPRLIYSELYKDYTIIK